MYYQQVDQDAGTWGRELRWATKFQGLDDAERALSAATIEYPRMIARGDTTLTILDQNAIACIQVMES